MMAQERLTNGDALKTLALVTSYFLTLCPNEREHFIKEVDEQIMLHKPSQGKA